MEYPRYRTTRAVILGRHNLRAPLRGMDGKLDRLTSHKWFFKGEAGQLSSKGFAMEEALGRAFKRIFSASELFPENAVPQEGEVRIYANSLQRTLESARAFTAGLFPTVRTVIEHHCAIDERDPFFAMNLPEFDEHTKQKILSEVQGIRSRYDLEESYLQTERVLDCPRFARSVSGDYDVVFKAGAQLDLTGAIKDAVTAADALLIQLYESYDPTAAAFGHSLSQNDWKAIGMLYVAFQEMCFSAPTVARVGAGPILKSILTELMLPGRKLTGYFGHDSNISSVLTVLNAQPDPMPETLTPNTPIGCKLVFSRLENESGTDLFKTELIYQSTKQLCSDPASICEPPICVPVRFSGIEPYDDAVYRTDEILKRFRSAVNGI